MNAQTNKIQADADGNLFLQLPADLVKDLKLAQNDEIDIMPTAMGFEVRKITDIEIIFGTHSQKPLTNIKRPSNS
ncbi:hypothetical protein [Secundilactobacillus paracollinoides]|uniref:hypothetical protein n=1 Tax=Secundilactobacillus paracollinoides TaxID=240427 RepID=UPI0006CFCA6C|nr:hypothetical protein [Secundilactobacillus paracollinoides]